ncbi:MAG: DNA alkylation repair protein [Myxococcales bacterium]|nr:DNA alkylation repair protein [Myxococcales bacterium]
MPELLDALADADAARRTARHTSCLRGIRGVPPGDIARVTAELYRADPPRLPRDATDIDRGFGGAFEDGLVAIGLLATAVADAPSHALRLGLDWAERTDDVTTADALGWLILAPSTLMTSSLTEALTRLAGHRRPETRRVAVAMGLGFTPTSVEGPAAAGLREKLGERSIRIVDHAQSDALARVCSRFVSDAAPPVQKALRRVVRAWADDDPRRVVRWASTVKAGLPRMLRDEVRRAKSRERRSS